VSAATFTTESGMRSKAVSAPWFYGVCLSGLVLVVFFLAFGPMLHAIKQARQRAWMQQAQAISVAMMLYYNNHGSYPDGNSSTEVFQKLLDEKYCSDPALFYVPLPGKIKAMPGQKLKPESVCFDVTSGAGPRSSKCPLVFLTGYKMNYAPGGTASPLVKPWPKIIVVYVGAGGTLFSDSQESFDGKEYLQLTPYGPLPLR
jgi:hypothetical protein